MKGDIDIEIGSNGATPTTSFPGIKLPIRLDNAIASTSRRSGLSVSASSANMDWSSDDTDDDDYIAKKLSSYRNLPPGSLNGKSDNSLQPSTSRKSGLGASTNKKRVSFSSENNKVFEKVKQVKPSGGNSSDKKLDLKPVTTNRKRPTAAKEPKARKKMKVVNRKSLSPPPPPLPAAEFKQELVQVEVISDSEEEELILQEDVVLRFDEDDNNKNIYTSLVNSELQGKVVVLSKGLAKKQPFFSEPLRDLHFDEHNLGVLTHLDKRCEEIVPGYVCLKPRTIRPFEISDKTGTVVILVMVGKQVRLKSCQYENEKPIPAVCQIPEGGYCVVPKGVPYSLENWSHKQASLFLVALRE